jgi:hypothetical protein
MSKKIFKLLQIRILAQSGRHRRSLASQNII